MHSRENCSEIPVSRESRHKTLVKVVRWPLIRAPLNDRIYPRKRVDRCRLPPKLCLSHHQYRVQSARLDGWPDCRSCCCHEEVSSFSWHINIAVASWQLLLHCTYLLSIRWRPLLWRLRHRVVIILYIFVSILARDVVSPFSNAAAAELFAPLLIAVFGAFGSWCLELEPVKNCSEPQKGWNFFHSLLLL